MNRQSCPEEVDAPELNNRGLYVFYGCDDSTSRQLAKLARSHQKLRQLPFFLHENDIYPEYEHLYVLTEDEQNRKISHAVAHLGIYGLSMYSVFERPTRDDLCALDDFGKLIYSRHKGHSF